MSDASGAQRAESASRNSRSSAEFPLLTVDEVRRLASMLKMHFASAWRAGRRMGLAPAQAEENAQEAFAIAARRLTEIPAGRERSFLLGAAVRLASNTRRGLASRLEHLTADPNEPESWSTTPLAEELIAQKEDRDLLDRVLQSMSVVLREVFTLYEIEELNLPEIAEALGIPEGTAASRLRRARVDFHARLTRAKRRYSSEESL